MANTITVPIVLGNAFHFTSQQLSTFTCGTFLVTGLISLLQVLFGHRLPIIEGPAGMWWGVFLILIQMAKDSGTPLSDLRLELEFALIAAGILNVCISIFGLLKYIERLFTPAVTGTFLLLLGLQLSKSLVSGMMGITTEGAVVNPVIAVTSLFLIGLTIRLMTKGRGMSRSLSVLICLLVGWALYLVIGQSHLSLPTTTSAFKLPTLFPWGKPSFHSGIVTTGLITSVILLSNLIASVKAMESVLPESRHRLSTKRATLISGIGNGLSGILGVVGLVPLTVAASLVSLTRNASRLPFVIASSLVILIGLFPWLGNVFSEMPVPVGYAVLFTVFAQLLGFGLQDIRKLEFTQRDLFVVGIPLMLGVGTYFISGSSWRAAPPVLGYLLDNGLIVGVVCVIILEHIVFHKPSR